MDENFASMLEAVADELGEELALVHGDIRRSYADYDDRGARLASAFEHWGLGPGSKVATYLHNHPAYLEADLAACKIRGVPVNVNYRYLADELLYLLDNSDAEVVFFSGVLADRVADVRDRCPLVKAWIQVEDGTPLLEGALGFEEVVAAHEPAPRIRRSGDDLLFLYTGGTTGMPKGVMWRTGDLLGHAVGHILASMGQPVPAGCAELGAAVRRLRAAGQSPVQLPTSPLMHGAGWGQALGALLLGGTVVTLPGTSFDPDGCWRAVEAHRVTNLGVVGDPFARPLVEALDRAAAEGQPYDVSTLKTVTSTGAMFSDRTKQALLGHCPGATIVDNLASSEALGMGRRTTTAGDDSRTATFASGAHAAVLDDEGNEIPAGSGQVGMLAVREPIPVGYYKDAEKTARTFRTYRGVRYSLPGDFATIDEDGTITLLGRGSVCINSGGEKIFPEEVEEVVKEMDVVADCLVVGVPDHRFGQRAVAVVSTRGDASVDLTRVKDHVRGRLAGYKAPRDIVVVPEVPRAPNGKADYETATAIARQAAGLVGGVDGSEPHPDQLSVKETT